MSLIKIISDSTADIPKNIQEEYDITVLPLTIIDGDAEYTDGVTMSPDEFYDILETCEKIPSSSRVAPGLFTQAYVDAWKNGYTDLIYVALNSKGSSTYHGAIMEMEDFYEENPEAKETFCIHIVDSLTYSMCYGWAVISAAKMAKEGREISEILESIDDWLKNTRAMFVPMNLKFVKKSGRVTAAAAFVGDALGLKPVITFEDGESKVISKIRGEKKVVSSLLDIVEGERKKGTPYFLVRGKNIELFEKYKAAAIERFGEEPEFVYPVGCIISINTGPDILGIIYKR